VRPILCFAAKGIVRDADSGTISAFSILEDLQPAGFPAVLPEAAVFALWRREPDEPAVVPLRFELRNNENVIVDGDWTVDFGSSRANRSVLNLQGVLVREPGVLSFNFVRDGAVITSYSVAVAAPPTRVEAQPAQPPTGTTHGN
jgi:hypothetical protein